MTKMPHPIFNCPCFSNKIIDGLAKSLPVKLQL